MKASSYLFLSALLAASAVSADQHQVRGRPNHLAHLVPRAPRPTPLGPSLFGGGDSDGSDSSRSDSASGASSSFDPFGFASSRSADAASSSSAAAAASSSSAAAAASSSSAAAAESASASASRAAAESSSIAAHAASSAAASISSAAAAASSSSAASRSSASAASASLASASSAALTTSTGLTTTLTATVVASPTAAAPTSTATKENSSDSSSGSGGGASTGLIIGVSVAGGVLVLAAFIFLYFKFGTRRFSNFEDGDTDIKWPELKHDPDSNVMQPLPARRTGNAGFGMGDDDSDNEGGEHDGAGEAMGEKGRDSFTGSTTALNATGSAAAYGDYQGGAYGVDPAAGYYQDHHMYAAHQYGMQTSPGAGAAYPDTTNPYDVDPYAHAGMSHPQQGYPAPHGHYQ